MRPIVWDERFLKKYYQVSSNAFDYLVGALLFDLAIRKLFFNQHNLTDLWLIAWFFFGYRALWVFRNNLFAGNQILTVFRIMLGILGANVILQGIVGIGFFLVTGLGSHLSLPVRLALSVPAAGLLALMTWGLLRLWKYLQGVIDKNERRAHGEDEPADIIYSDEPVDAVLDPGKPE